MIKNVASSSKTCQFIAYTHASLHRIQMLSHKLLINNNNRSAQNITKFYSKKLSKIQADANFSSQSEELGLCRGKILKQQYKHSFFKC
ncbi:hypothetical protein BQ13140 [Bartonella quintana str. Toulouse]|uniref:Uncharacterized protein n=1 Tax=Bartonella quintana (strain Toulouse) TaxID=283165 RepID=A0A0H3LV61_BARQU|nr:hypothetical protein BQ13140 [Bartonella quintana str. Toulouse]